MPSPLPSKCYVTHLVCPKCELEHDFDCAQTVCRACESPLLVVYDLAGIASALKKAHLLGRAPEMWRYREFLPVRDPERIVSLGETMTPLISARALAADLGVVELFIKDEGRLPTASFKARGLAMAVTKAAEYGVTRVVIPTAGNAGGALAAYGARAGMEVFVFCPEDAPEINAKECAMNGAVVCLVNGLINDCGKIVREGKSIADWFDMSTLREPYRIEGKKTMGLELAEQTQWSLPEAVFYPTGGGTGLIGMWKAFDELEAVGWIDSRRPKLISVQAEGCAPIVKAFDDGADESVPWEDARTLAAGIRVPHALGDFLILRAIRETNGAAVAVSDEDILDAQKRIAEGEGIIAAPEGAATLAALEIALERGIVAPSDRVVLFNTGSGLKYPMDVEFLRIDKEAPIDYQGILEAARETGGAREV